MKIQLISCDAQRPNARNITKMLEEVAGLDNYDARDLTDVLLDGTAIEIEVFGKSTSSAYRAFRKLEIDYEIMDED